MQNRTIFLESIPGFTTQIGHFLSSLEKIRSGWREAVRDLTKAELATKILPDVQPIGTIIIHIAEVEYFWIQEIVSGKPMTDEVRALLHHDLWFKDFAAENLEVEYCLETVEKIQSMTRDTLSRFTDNELEKTFVRRYEDRETHFSLRWIFVHLLEHDAEHKGQMLMIKRLIRNS